MGLKENSHSNSQGESEKMDDELNWLNELEDGDDKQVDQSGDADHPAGTNPADPPESPDENIDKELAENEPDGEAQSDLETQLLNSIQETPDIEGDIDATLVNVKAQKVHESEIPDWLKALKPKEAVTEDDEAPVEDDLGWLDKIAEGEGESLDEPSTMSWDSQNEVPEDPDEAMAWLEQLAAQQGAPKDELPSLKDEAESAELQLDDGDLVEVAPVGSEEELSPGDEESSADAAEKFDQFAAAVESELQRIERERDQGQLGSIDENEQDYSEMPEDPDEAMAWLEKLAARQGAQIDELPTLSETQEEESVSAGESEEASIPTEDETAIHETIGEVELPADDDEALAWLEELAEDEPAELDKDASIIDEAITPIKPLDVEEARREVEELFPESPLEEEAGKEEVVFSGDEDDTFQWIDQMAEGRPGMKDTFAGQSIDDLAVTEELKPPDWLVDSDEDLEEIDAEFDQHSRELMEELTSVSGEDDLPQFEYTETLDEDLVSDDDVTDTVMTSPLVDKEEPADADAIDSSSVDVEDETGVPVEEREPADSPVLEGASADDVTSQHEEPEEALLPSADDETPDELYDDAEERAGEEEVAEDGADFPIPESESEAASAVESLDGADVPSEADVDHELVDVQDVSEWMADSPEIDAEAWLDGEAAVADGDQPVESISADESTRDKPDFDRSQTEFVPIEESIDSLAEEEILKPPDRELLDKARKAISSGDQADAVESFEALLQQGHGIPYLIADLEHSIEEYGAQLPLQRILGDAYAQNGQLAKALSTYRKALDTL